MTAMQGLALMQYKRPLLPKWFKDYHRSSRPDSDMRQYVKHVPLGWILSNVWIFMITGAAFTKFAKAIHLPDSYFGLLAAAPFIGAMFQIPASILLECFGHRKATSIACQLIGRFIWVFIALIPWVIPDDQDALRWGLLAGLTTLTWILNNLAGPANTAWLADAVPPSLRGRFVSFCLRWSQPVILVVVLGVGYLIDVAEKAEDGKVSQPLLMLKLCSMLLAIAGLVGVFGILRHAMAPDPKPVTGTGWNPQLLYNLKKPLVNPGFRRYLLVNFTFFVGTGFVGQYIWLYMFDVGHMTALAANGLLVAMPRVITMFTYRFWGRQIDAHGKKPVMLLCMGVMSISFFGWIIAAQGSTWHVLAALPLIVLEVACLPGWEVTNLNVLLDFSSSKQGGTSAAVAINAMAVAIGGIISGALGSLFASVFAEVNFEIVAMDFTVTYHVLLMLLVVFVRLIVCLLVLRLDEPKATATRDLIREVSSGVFYNTRQAILMPTRIVGQISRWTYKLRQ
ncbi:MAG TPA: hypothetical protein DCM28_12260 [Phycisphaerales bacterium]|nr:hypothetical protein [Phycisphaerales bacterium]